MMTISDIVQIILFCALIFFPLGYLARHSLRRISCHFQKATAQNSEAECTTSVNVPIGVGWRGAGSKLNEWSFRLTRSFVATF